MAADPQPGDVIVRERLLATAAATQALGEWLGQHLLVGDVLALCGELGAGKTCVVRGLARGLAVLDPDAVASPTYLLVVEHDGPRPLLHMDAYLPAKLSGFLVDGGADYLTERQAVVAIEWAERVTDLLPADATLWLDLQHDPSGRRAILRGPVQRFAWLADLP